MALRFWTATNFGHPVKRIKIVGAQLYRMTLFSTFLSITPNPFYFGRFFLLFQFLAYPYIFNFHKGAFVSSKHPCPVFSCFMPGYSIFIQILFKIIRFFYIFTRDPPQSLSHPHIAIIAMFWAVLPLLHAQTS